MEKITVLKIGGNVVDNPDALGQFIKDFVRLPGKKILVHGGGKKATRLSERLNIPTTMIEGRRVTTRETLDVVTMVYAGLVNKRIVSLLQAEGCNAIGLTGADGNSITAVRRDPRPVDYGYVGDIHHDGINLQLITSLLESGITPLICSITHDGHGTLLNCNADSIASAVAIGASRIAPTELVFCFEHAGVMEDINRPDSVIPLITHEIYDSLRKAGIVNKGMIPKIDNAFAAISAGVESVTIKHSGAIACQSGTLIKN